jgi:hypothetical protein
MELDHDIDVFYQEMMTWVRRRRRSGDGTTQQTRTQTQTQGDGDYPERICWPPHPRPQMERVVCELGGACTDGVDENSDDDEDNGDYEGEDDGDDEGPTIVEVEARLVRRHTVPGHIEGPLFVPWERPASALVDPARILLATGKYVD